MDNAVAYTAEASSLGWKPGEWPPIFVSLRIEAWEAADGCPIPQRIWHRSQPILSPERELVAYQYMDASGKSKLIVFND